MSQADGIGLIDVDPFTTLVVRTDNSVYRITIRKPHAREVVLKILPDAFANDPDRLARFKREAQILASLNHPNIAQIHGIAESEGTGALVLELVEGPMLADRIAKGPIPTLCAHHVPTPRASRRPSRAACVATSRHTVGRPGARPR